MNMPIDRFPTVPVDLQESVCSRLALLARLDLDELTTWAAAAREGLEAARALRDSGWPDPAVEECLLILSFAGGFPGGPEACLESLRLAAGKLGLPSHDSPSLQVEEGLRLESPSAA
ncbi:hypothetical protein OJF2_28220 [Aquisphaera giovannonii]|uniref:Uncharacterized protein n=1 Tax=Aquisphaera giovannonii TaxID=406548 RepID=A0A5B9W202_9BACT|nr:hypothetical protein [Aquisphaera giovannonii]QEH34287.1 hypothetical protein OJF2_28220 [Aquisphaera giovannonii]